ncbi:30S ribosome-binding factor RbfA [Thiohalocapsa marina]|uniref:Ribosome-binding factor A n=1 Tax=Thiohalocapsa marina TaxID=424902 RepID=A0A5M8FVY2_9GAMM|nr:30S ribosome-binding factor RbfA [Thiohalocapsa marina]KAA6187889.1 30S ribosome-binding factor RbfA [Thiohalocapsa marina]
MSRVGGRDFDRSERIGAELLRELTLILRGGVKDPRLGEITLQEVRVSRDLSHAKVYFTCFPLDDCGPGQQRLLNGTLAGYLRAQLARRVRLRTVPQLHFVHDDSVLDGERLSALIEQAVADTHGDDADSPAGDGEAPASGSQPTRTHN